MGRWARVCLMALAGLGAHAGVGRASSLDNLIPGLYGGSLPTTTNPGFAPPEGQPLQFGKQFKSLSGALAAARSQVPVPSASGAFRFGWDPELDTFVRSDQSLGSMFAERAQTLGRHTGTVSLAYTRIDFDSFEGTSLNNLRFSQPAVSPDQLSGLPPSDQVKFGNDQMRTRLNLGLSYDLLFLTAAFGVTDTIDASMALSINHAHMNGSAVTTIDNPDGTPGNSFFALNAQGQLDAPSGRICTGALLPKCATDGFSESAWGTGDLFLRGKWHFYDTQYADLAAVATLTLPTGNANNLLGFYDPTFTPLLVASKSFGPVSPHLNLGYAFRSDKDVSQALWVAGADVRATGWLTVFSDFLGFHDDNRDGINDDIYQSAVGFKVNPIDRFVLGAGFQFPLNDAGIRADVIYSTQIEYTF
jgi:hypothetical protein